MADLEAYFDAAEKAFQEEIDKLYQERRNMWIEVGYDPATGTVDADILADYAFENIPDSEAIASVANRGAGRMEVEFPIVQNELIWGDREEFAEFIIVAAADKTAETFEDNGEYLDEPIDSVRGWIIDIRKNHTAVSLRDYLQDHSVLQYADIERACEGADDVEGGSLLVATYLESLGFERADSDVWFNPEERG